MRSVFPALTYPGHTTMVTGALPARHGVCHNKHFEAVTDPPWLKDASAIRVPALWDAVRASGGTTGAVLWPMTTGALIEAAIAPLVAELLGLDFEAPDGVLYPGLLAEE